VFACVAGRQPQVFPAAPTIRPDKERCEMYFGLAGECGCVSLLREGCSNDATPSARSCIASDDNASDKERKGRAR